MDHPIKVEASPPHQNPKSLKSLTLYSPVKLSLTLHQGSSPEEDEEKQDPGARRPRNLLLPPRFSVSGDERFKNRRSELFPSDAISAESSPSSWGFNGPLKINTSNASLGGLIRSAMLRQSSSTSTSFGDQTPSTGRGMNAIHLRRLLDPWLKPRKVAAGSPGPSSLSDKKTGSSIEGSPNSSSHSSDMEGSTSSRWVDQEMKQSLLRLTWKNGFPLFTFSVNASDILAATRKEEDKGSEFSYTFYSIHGEKKKKNSGWISQGKDGGRKELISSVAGQMSKSSKRPSFKEFVLYSSDNESSELAAISIRVLGETLKTSDLGRKYPCPSEPSVAVVLPSQVHGKSKSESGGKPSPLLDRWRSGGLCDCGGWDVGCALTVLVGHLREGNSHRVELFFQGGSSEGKPAFSLVVFKEGLYTVYFDASINPLQAFAVCISLLHCRNSGLRAPNKSLK